MRRIHNRHRSRSSRRLAALTVFLSLLPFLATPAPSVGAATTVTLSYDQLLTMLRQIYPDCRLTSVSLYADPYLETKEMVTVLEFHLTTESVGATTADHWAYKPLWVIEKPPIEHPWWVDPETVWAFASDLDGDGAEEICIAFHELKPWQRRRGPLWQQLAVFRMRDGRPRLLDARPVGPIRGNSVGTDRLEVVDLGRRRGIFSITWTHYGGTTSDYYMLYDAEILLLENDKLESVFSEGIGRKNTGSGYEKYDAVPRLDFRDLDGDGMAELMLLDRTVDKKIYVGPSSSGYGVPCADLIINHVPRVYAFDGNAFQLRPNFFSTTETLRWEHLSVSPVYGAMSGDAKNRAHYFLLDDDALLAFGGTLWDWSDPAKPVDRIHIRAPGRGRPLWQLAYGWTGGRRDAIFALDDYRKAKVHKTTPDEMDYRWSLGTEKPRSNLRRRSRVLKVFPALGGLVILEEWSIQADGPAGWRPEQFSQSLTTDGVFHAFNAIPNAPALVCRGRESNQRSLVLVRVYLDFADVGFDVPPRKPSGEAEGVTVRCTVRHGFWHGDNAYYLGKCIWFAPIIDTRRPDWETEVYALIGRAIEGVSRFQAEKPWLDALSRESDLGARPRVSAGQSDGDCS